MERIESFELVLTALKERAILTTNGKNRFYLVDGKIVCHINFEHFISNILYILLLGPMLEEKHNRKMIVVILITALVTGIFNSIISPNTQLLGASGVVFAFIIWSSITGKDKGIPVTLIIVAVLWIGGEILDAVTVADTVSQISHIIGGLVGGIVGMFYKDEK